MGAFVSNIYFKNLNDAKNKTKYICFRERQGEKERLGIFSKDNDNASLKGFQKLLDDKKTSHSSVAVAHELVFSMSRNEWERSGFEPGDYKTFIREVMSRYEMTSGKRLEWVSAEHLNDNNPHAHVMIKAVYHDRDGVPFRLRIDKPEREVFREIFQEVKNDIRGFELQPPQREWEQSKENMKNKNKAKNTARPLLESLKRRIEESRRQGERERENDYEYRR
ncbi:hypothetical protein [Peribacillus frigoritolerans]|uniref:hypothetical protein n=1 Tax=Peribacillus TaxID=2675229 RepID=UPI0023DA6B15|nr:hypothetical protein [Peribacillus frigoritolerans]MDF1995812.1 hypothetical protein [Peribacillus frigoritolerans]